MDCFLNFADTDMKGRADLPPLQLAAAVTKWSERKNEGRREEGEERRIVDCFVVAALFRSALLFLVISLSSHHSVRSRGGRG
uniref:Uncharacterized protein n=1 Tax=Nelumbo nucifera TaxID=4432 RepID=A0A822XJU8_NELNU|nr:TPA_asm: hypothetical protein HUJ06_022030 [Nelumbo nucifera]